MSTTTYGGQGFKERTRVFKQQCTHASYEPPSPSVQPPIFLNGAKFLGAFWLPKEVVELSLQN